MSFSKLIIWDLVNTIFKIYFDEDTKNEITENSDIVASTSKGSFVFCISIL